MGRGRSGIGSASASTQSSSPVGQSTKEFSQSLTFDNVEQKLGLRELSTAQKNTLLSMFRGMAENDYSYDSNRTPYAIRSMSITQPFIDNNLIRSTDVQVSIWTGGNTGRSYADSFDNRYRQFFIDV